MPGVHKEFIRWMMYKKNVLLKEINNDADEW